MGAVAACLAIVIAVDGILAPFSGGMIVSAYAYGTDEEITTAGAVMNSGTISDSGAGDAYTPYFTNDRRGSLLRGHFHPTVGKAGYIIINNGAAKFE